MIGVLRDTFYRYQEFVEQGGVDSLVNQSRRVPNFKNRTDEATEKAVIKDGCYGLGIVFGGVVWRFFDLLQALSCFFAVFCACRGMDEVTDEVAPGGAFPDGFPDKVVNQAVVNRAHGFCRGVWRHFSAVF